MTELEIILFSIWILFHVLFIWFLDHFFAKPLRDFKKRFYEGDIRRREWEIYLKSKGPPISPEEERGLRQEQKRGRSIPKLEKT